MSTRASAATACAQFAATAASCASAVALRTRDGSISWTWSDYAERSRQAAGALSALGVRRGDAVCLWLRNRPGLHAADAGAMLLGAVPVPIYTTAGDGHASHVIGDSGCRVLITESAFLGAALAIRSSGLTALGTIVLMEGAGSDALAWDAILADADPAFDHWPTALQARPDDPITIVYTAGSTGRPKGVRITHANVAAQVTALTDSLGLTHGMRVVSSLPTATIADRLCSQYLPMWLGWEVTCCPDPALAPVFLREVRPEFLFAAPWTWEALRVAFMARIDNAEALRALDLALHRVYLLDSAAEIPQELTAACAAADAAFFTPLRARLGLGDIRHSLMGAARCPPGLSAFFRAIGVPAAELYGLTESTGVVSINTAEGRTGHVGQPLPGCELRLSQEHEILVRGPVIATSYQDGPQAERASTDADGWLSTGDTGAIGPDGGLRIVDRIDALIRTQAGLILSPANVETALCAASPLVGHACVVGEGRPYPVALLTLDGDGARRWARDHELGGADLGVLANHPEVLGAVAGSVAEANLGLDAHERIRRFQFLGADWEPGGDELTQTSMLRRHVIACKYAPELEALYEGDGVEPTQR
jgi:long-subunit acyl-CoA synthetase (AMP-forming)